jgi:thioredoxin-related protein
MFHFVREQWEIKQSACIKFCNKLGKFDTETNEMLHEAFREHFSTQTVGF